MAQVRNETDLPCCFFEKVAREREIFDVMVVRGTFDFGERGGDILFAEEQEPLVDADEHEGPVETDPLAAVLAREGDLIIHKPSTDVHVIGKARPHGGRPVTDWIASVTVGPVEKSVRLTGPRWFERSMGGFRLTPASPTDGVELDYRSALGGTFRVPGSLLPDGQDAYLMKEDNPAGTGWLPDEQMLRTVSKEARPYFEAQVDAAERLVAPQIEHPGEPIRSPFARTAAQGLGPIARWWSPRTRYAGTYDARWFAKKYPALPDDFDPRFYQSAHPDLVCPRYLRGNEGIVLDGLVSQGRVSMRLPAVLILAGFIRQSGEAGGGRLELDTVIVDLDDRRVSLVWRGAFHKRDPIAEISIGLFGMDESAAEAADGRPSYG